MTATTTMTDALLTRKSHIRSIFLTLTGSLLIAILARVAIPLPFSPVPFSGQTLAVLLLGALLGSRLGAMSAALYLFQGAIGLPVFVYGAGPAYLFGPTGGYIFGFVAAAYITGWLAERGWDRKVHTTAAAMVAGSAAIYIAGLAQLSLYTGASNALAAGFYPFIITDLLKVALAAVMLPSGWKLLNMLNNQ